MVEYIEKQKAIKLLDMCMVAAEKRWKEATNPLAKIEFKADKDTIEAMIEVVVSVESADVQPVKHGKWIWVKDYRDCEGDKCSQYKCSCCDFGVGGVYFIKDLTHFCGNCGARMIKDGDAE